MKLNAMQDDGSILAKALERRARALQEMRDIDTFLSTYAALAGKSLDTLLGGGEPSVGKTGPLKEEVVRYHSQEVQALEADDPGGGMPQREFTNLAKELLLAHGRPMQSHPLLNAFHEIGRRVGGKDELRNLTTKLWRSRDEITKVPGAGYWPIEVPCPAVRYVPPQRPATAQPSPLDDSASPHSPDDLSDEDREQRDAQLRSVGGRMRKDEQTAYVSSDDLDDEIPF